ncbi:type II toxin-antitoxin system HicA family toxin [Parabacteroides sp. OttesenSCG-928-G06]|nr:type II toxin-antitoxin system HicA family toxin [Parabacteroides sp. OttesenSCG-928-G06]
MKYKEFHRLILRNGWEAMRQKGSHVIYVKNGLIETVPNHGSKEMPEGLRLTLIKRMGLH